MIEYILALLLTFAILYLVYKAGKRAGVKQEQLRVLNEKDKEWERFVNISNSVNNMSIDNTRDRLQDISNK